MPPNQPPAGGYPPPGDGGYNPQGAASGSGGQSQSGWPGGGTEPTQQYGQSPYGGQTGEQPTTQFGAPQSGHGEPAPQWGQPQAGYGEQPPPLWQPEYPGQPGYGGPPPKKASALPWIIGGLVLLLVAGGVALYFVFTSGDEGTPVAGPSSTSSEVTTEEESSEEETTEEETTEEETTEEETTEEVPEIGPPPPPGAPAPTGSGDPAIDALAAGCFAGVMQDCDDLYFMVRDPADNSVALPGLEVFFDYGFECGQRLSTAEVGDRECVDIYTDA